MARLTDFGGDCPGYVVTPEELNDFIEDLTYEAGEHAIDNLECDDWGDYTHTTEFEIVVLTDEIVRQVKETLEDYGLDYDTISDEKLDEFLGEYGSRVTFETKMSEGSLDSDYEVEPYYYKHEDDPVVDALWKHNCFLADEKWYKKRARQNIAYANAVDEAPKTL
nr:MAG TPA: hypothetical protein [Caudoviricetes sp.]